MTVMAGAAISPALPGINAAFGTGPRSALLVKLVLTIPALAIALVSPLIGLLIDKWRRKPVLLGAVLLYGAAGSSGFFAPTLNALLLGRIGLGLAVAGLMTCSTTLVGDYFTGAERNRFLGWQTAAMSCGGVVFVLLGGFLADVSWRAPFAVYALAFLVLPLLWATLKEPTREQTGKDLPASTTDVLPWRLLALLYPLAIVCQIIFYLIPAQLPFHLQALLNAPAVLSGVAMAWFNLCSALLALRYRVIRERLSFTAIALAQCALMGAGYLWLSRAGVYWQVLGSMALAGAGLGLLNANLNVWLLAYTPESLRGRAVGGLATCIFLGQFLSPIVGTPRGPIHTLAGVYAAAGVVLVILALGFGIAVIWQKNRATSSSKGIIMDTLTTLKQRISANHFDASRKLSEAEIKELIGYATEAPSSFNIQHWRFVAVTEQAAKERLQAVAYGQPKVAAAAVTFIILGDLRGHEKMRDIYQPMLDAGAATAEQVDGWVGMAAGMYAHAQNARDEAIRSASLAAMALMLAADAKGLVSGPMIGFDPEGVKREFGISDRYVPVMLLSVGYAAPGNRPRKPRLPVDAVLSFNAGREF